ncbi:hypothetical protein SDC9_188394 [bioreactor metagenome]|uniref:Uncharacterized protein n=1 Tax=bioreactor metagenome TaxID=1076179 RepID=A0A645HXG0_9ZZZZ
MADGDGNLLAAVVDKDARRRAIALHLLAQQGLGGPQLVYAWLGLLEDAKYAADVLHVQQCIVQCDALALLHADAGLGQHIGGDAVAGQALRGHCTLAKAIAPAAKDKVGFGAQQYLQIQALG